MSTDLVAEDGEDRRRRESAEHRASIVAMNAEIAESALDSAFVEWWAAPTCRRLGAACTSGHTLCRVDDKRHRHVRAVPRAPGASCCRGHVNIRIMCARCGKPVERWECMEEMQLASYRFRVYCHGEIDVCIVEQHFVETNGPHALEAGRAFVPRLGHPN